MANRIVRRGIAALAGVLALAFTVGGCGGDDDGEPTGADAGFKVGLLLPESKTTRYEVFDRPYIEAKLGELCARCEVLYENADADAAKQRTQAETMLAEGVRVLILDAVDASAAAEIVTAAQTRNVPVIAYDRLARGPVSYYVSFDNTKVGQVQARSLLDALGATPAGPIVMINGSPTDPNAADFKAGAHSVLDGKVTIGKEYDTPDWSDEKARAQMSEAITALGATTIAGVYAANDGTASGAIAALQDAGVTKLPPVTGQDAEIAAIQRILSGEQHMTVYKAIKPEADVAAAMAVAAATGVPYTGETTTTVDNGTKDVTAVLLTPVVVTRDNVKDTVITDGFYTAAQLCTGRYATACADAGIS